jgi:predicted HicB family RNase H-like nuclease
MSKSPKAEEATPDERVVSINARVSKDLWRAVRLRAIEREVTVRDFVSAALREKLDREQAHVDA